MYLLSWVQKYAGIGRLVSLVTGFAASNGSATFFTKMLRVPLSGLMNDMNLPSGESCAPEISGSPKNSSRSMIGGCWATARAAKTHESSSTVTRDRIEQPPGQGYLDDNSD